MSAERAQRSRRPSLVTGAPTAGLACFLAALESGKDHSCRLMRRGSTRGAAGTGRGRGRGRGRRQSSSASNELIRQLEAEAEALKKFKEEARRQLHVLQVDEAELLGRLTKLQARERRRKPTKAAVAQEEVGAAEGLPDDLTGGEDDEVDLGQYVADIELEMELESELPEQQSVQDQPQPGNLNQGQGQGHSSEQGQA